MKYVLSLYKISYVTLWNKIKYLMLIYEIYPMLFYEIYYVFLCDRAMAQPHLFSKYVSN